MKKWGLWPFARRQHHSSEPSPSHHARFIRTDVPSQGALPLHSPLCRLGRSADNHLCFQNDSVSGHHAEVYHLPDGSFQIYDLQSTNGTRVNSQPVQAQVLRHGDVVELGEVRLHFRDREE